MPKNLKNKILKMYNDREECKKYKNERANIIKNNKRSELIINHYLGYSRGALFLVSYDLEQLREIKQQLENRGIKCELLENYCGRWLMAKMNLMPDKREEISMEEKFNRLLLYSDKNFVNRRPIPNFDFFTEHEKELMRKWW